MDTHHLLHRHREGIERIVITQILFGGAREFTQVTQLTEIIRVNPRRIKLTAVHRHIFVGVFQRPLQAFGLQSL